MKKTIKALKFPVAFLFIVISFIACDKDFNVIESDVLGKENANFTTSNTTYPIAAYNRELSSLKINNLASNLLGVFNDPAYGKTTASIVTQVTPASFNPDFGTNPVINSVVINIPYFSSQYIDTEGNTAYTLDSLYGNPAAPFKLTIYQNNYFLRDLDPSSNNAQNYYSNSNSVSNSILTGSGTVVNFDEHTVATIHEELMLIPSNQPIETTTGEGDDATTTLSAPAYRVVLQDPEDILYWTSTIISKEGEPELSNANNFRDYFRGLYFKAESIGTDGNMFLINLASTGANITIHYSKDSTINDDERTQSTYVLNFSGNRLNTFVNDYNLVNFPVNPDKELGDEKLYLKGASGSMAIVDLFPNGLEDFKNEFLDADGNQIKLINEAHLVVYEDETMPTLPDDENGDAYHKYDRIYAYDIKNNTPTFDYQVDQTENTQNAFGSKVISLSQRDTILGRFKIRLTEHLNNILQRDSTNTKIGLVLSTNVNYTNNAEILNSDDEVTGVPAAALLTPRGTILHGSNENVPDDKRLMLKIFYTEPN